MTFVGGPPTIGPGLVVSREKTETIRSHPELQKVQYEETRTRSHVPTRVPYAAGTMLTAERRLLGYRSCVRVRVRRLVQAWLYTSVVLL
jgi:hypothetical protein